MTPIDFSSLLHPDALADLKADTRLAQIEGQRRLLRADERPISSLPGGTAKFDDQTIAQAARGSKNTLNCLRLARLARDFGPPVIVELGTNLGISSAYLAAGASPGVRVRTGDMSGARIAIARDLHHTLGLANIDYVVGEFAITLGDLLQPEIGLCFIDGDHTYTGTMRYFESVRPLMKPHGVVVFDDIEWSEGMRQAWDEITITNGLVSVASIDGVGYVQV